MAKNTKTPSDKMLSVGLYFLLGMLNLLPIFRMGRGYIMAIVVCIALMAFAVLKFMAKNRLGGLAIAVVSLLELISTFIMGGFFFSVIYGIILILVAAYNGLTGLANGRLFKLGSAVMLFVIAIMFFLSRRIMNVSIVIGVLFIIVAVLHLLDKPKTVSED